MSFGSKLRSLIENENITQKELAKQLNIAPSTLGSYVQDKREPDFATLKQLCSRFDVSIDYILEYTPKESTQPTALETEMLRTFRSLTREQQLICLEQSRVFKKFNQTR